MYNNIATNRLQVHLFILQLHDLGKAHPEDESQIPVLQCKTLVTWPPL